MSWIEDSSKQLVEHNGVPQDLNSIVQWKNLPIIEPVVVRCQFARGSLWSNQPQAEYI